MARDNGVPVAGRGVVVRHVRNERARRLGASSGDRCAARPVAGEGFLLFPLSSSSADGAPPDRGPAGRLVRTGTRIVAPPDLAYTLAQRRGHRPVRTAVIAGSLAELTEGLREIAGGRHPVSGGGRARRPGTGLGVLWAGFAMGGDGR